MLNLVALKCFHTWGQIQPWPPQSMRTDAHPLCAFAAGSRRAETLWAALLCFLCAKKSMTPSVSNYHLLQTTENCCGHGELRDTAQTCRQIRGTVMLDWLLCPVGIPHLAALKGMGWRKSYILRFSLKEFCAWKNTSLLLPAAEEPLYKCSYAGNKM